MQLDINKLSLEGETHTCKMAKYFLPLAKSVLHRLLGNLVSPGKDGTVAALDAEYQWLKHEGTLHTVHLKGSDSFLK